MFWEESFAIIADRDGEGNPTKIVGTTMRIDERKKLEADLINARNKQLINEIQSNNRKLLRIIDGLVSMSRIEAEAKNLVKSQTDLVPLLDDIAKEYGTMVDQQSVVLATQFPYTKFMITTDVSKLHEIISNLMQNAVNHRCGIPFRSGFYLLGEYTTHAQLMRLFVFFKSFATFPALLSSNGQK